MNINSTHQVVGILKRPTKQTQPLSHSVSTIQSVDKSQDSSSGIPKIQITEHDEFKASSENTLPHAENGNQVDARRVLINVGLMSDSEATSGTTTRAREKGILEQGLTEPHMQNHDVSASPNIHESSEKKALISTFNKFWVLEEGDENSLDIHSEPLQEGNWRMKKWPIQIQNVYPHEKYPNKDIIDERSLQRIASHKILPRPWHH